MSRDAASTGWRTSREVNKLIDRPVQGRGTISGMAALRGELLSKQLELSYLSSFSSSSESSVRQTQQHIAALQGKLNQLEQASPPAANAGSAATSNGSFFPEAMRVPELRFQLEQLVREQKIRETLFFLMSQRYETAKADEARDTSTFQILDYPTLPTKKSRPKRLRILMSGFAWGAVISCLAIVGLEWRRRRKAELSARATS